MGYSLGSLLIRAIDFYSFLILISVLGSWVDPYRKSKIFQTVEKFTEPYLKLFRKYESRHISCNWAFYIKLRSKENNFCNILIELRR